MLHAYYADGNLNTTTRAGNTTAWALAIPALVKAYPDAPVELRLTPEGVPNCTVSAAVAGVACDVLYRLNSSVVLANNSRVHTHTLGVAISTVFGLSLTNDVTPPYNTSIVGNVMSLNLHTTVEQSSIGPIATLPLDLVSSLLGPTATAILNKVLARGVAIPSADFGVQLQGGEIQYHEGFFAVGTSFVAIKPPNATTTAGKPVKWQSAATAGL